MTRRSNEQAFVIPSGAEIRAVDDGLILGNQGDVAIIGQPSFKLHQLESRNGSIELASDTPLTLTRIEAPKGEVRLSGSITVQTILARKILFVQGNLSVRSLVADDEISLRGDTLQTDIIIAPRVELGDKLKGRATVIESKNDIGPTLLKGGFRLDEYLEIFPNGRETIEQNPDVKARLEGWKDVKLTPPSEPALEVAREPGPVGQAEEAVDSGLLPIREPDAEPEVLTLTDTVPGAVAGGETDSWSAQALSEELAGQNRSLETGVEELYHRLSESFLKIMGCYSDLKLPPPLNTLETLIEERKFETLRKQLTGLWNELLQYHKREGLHIANAVTHNIQEMKKLLQDRA